MKKYRICLSILSIWTILFLLLAIRKNQMQATGLQALTSLGEFVVYSILCIAGIIGLVVVGIIWLLQYHKVKKGK